MADDDLLLPRGPSSDQIQRAINELAGDISGITATSVPRLAGTTLAIAPLSYLNVLDYGALGDNRQVVDGAMTAASAVLISATAAFTSADIGKQVRVRGAGASYNLGFGTGLYPVDSTVVSVQSSTQVTLGIAATTTVSGATTNIGTNDTAAIQATIDAASVLAGTLKGRVRVEVPAGKQFRLVATATQLFDVIPGGSGYLYAALMMKSGVDLAINGELYFPFTGVFGGVNYTTAISAAYTESRFSISGAGLLNGGGPAGTDEWIHQGVHILGASHFTVTGLEVAGFLGDGIRADGGNTVASPVWPTRFRIESNYVRDTAGQAVEVNGGERFVIVDNICAHHLNFDLGAGAECIWIQGTDFVVNGNLTSQWGSAVALHGTCTNGVIVGNTFDHEITYSGAATNIAISGNRVTTLRADGLATENGLTVSGNTFKNSLTAQSINVGTVGGIGVTVVGNTCEGTLVTGAASGLIVSGNKAAGGSISGTRGTITGNRFTSLFLLNAADCVMTGNYIETTVGNALDIAAARCLVSNNYLKTTAASAHAIFGSSGSTVDNTVIADNTLDSASGNALNMNGPTSKVGLVARSNKLITGSVVGVFEEAVTAPWQMVPNLTIDHGASSATLTPWDSANRAYYWRTSEHKEITSIVVEVGTSSGNISVATYANSGAGRGGLPTGGRTATSGAIACPAGGVTSISLGATINHQRGDWFGMSCDNAVATFIGYSTGIVVGAIYTGIGGYQLTAHPCPATPALTGNGLPRGVVLLGV